MRLKRAFQFSSAALVICIASLSWVSLRAQAAVVSVTTTLSSALFELLVPPAGSTSPSSVTTESHEFLVNGAQVLVQITRLPTPVTAANEAALTQKLGDRMRKWCRTPRLAEGATPKEESLLHLPVLSVGEDGDEHIFCFRPRHELSVAGLGVAMSEFESEGDLSALGQVLSARIRRGQTGVSVLTIESRGPLVLEAMFPASGDAPGADPRELPRPRGKRILSFVRKERVALAVYDAGQEGSSPLDAFEARLRARGLSVERVEASSPSSADALYVRAGTESFVVTCSPPLSETKKARQRLFVARLP